MHVVYDLLGLQSRDHGERGIARFVMHLGLELERTNPGLVTQYLMHPNLPLPAGVEELLATGRVVRADREHPAMLPSSSGIFIAGSPFEDYHLPSELVFPAWTRSPRWRRVAILHDLIPALFPELYLKREVDRFNYYARLNALAGVDWLLANSQASADDATAMLGPAARHMTVIGAGADSQFVRPPVTPAEVAAGLRAEDGLEDLRPGYLLFPTGLDPRKNIERTIEAYGKLPEALRRQHQLVLSCRVDGAGWKYLCELADAAGVTGDLLVTGFVTDQVLCRLYQGADLVVFSSLYEGFGLPVLEAMKCGAPVVVADSSSLKEVQLLPEARFDPYSVDAIAFALHRALTDDGLIARLRTQELPDFSWVQAARLTAGVIEELRAGHSVGVRDRTAAVQPRLALACPLSSDPDGAAAVRALATELAPRCSLTLFTDVDGAAAGLPAGVSVQPLAWLPIAGSGGAAFDRVLYVLGDDPSYVPVLQAMNRQPGWVLLRDVRLGGLYDQAVEAAPELLVAGSVGATVAKLYPDRYRLEVEERETLGADVADRFGILLATEVANRAQAVVVESNYAGWLLELDTGVRPLVPYLAPFPAPGARTGTAANPSLLVFGQAAGIWRDWIVVLDALAQLQAIRPDLAAGLRVTVADDLGDDHAKALLDLARAHEVAEAVTVINGTDRALVADVAASATAALQLSRPALGDRSCSLRAGLLARGVPVAVTDAAAWADLPDAAVAKLNLADGPTHTAERLVALLTDERKRANLGDAARRHAGRSSWATAAANLAEALFRFDA